MKRFFLSAARLAIIGAAVILAANSGLFSPGRIAGNSRFPGMECRAVKALRYA